MPALSFQTAIQPSMRGESVRMTLRWKLPSGSFSSLCVLLKGVSLRLRAVTAFVKRKESSTLRPVRVVEVARVDVGVERKVLRTLGLKFGDAGLREAVKREVAHVLIAVEHADEVEANVLLHEAERGDEAFDLLA